MRRRDPIRQPLVPGASAVKIAVTAVGAWCALGRTPDAIFERLCQGDSALTGPAPWGGKGPAARIGTDDAPMLSTPLALDVCGQVLQGTHPELAVFGATTASDMWAGEEAFRLDHQGEDVRPGQLLWRQLSHAPTTAVCDALGSQGPRGTISTACTSGAVAIVLAAQQLLLGHAPAALAFGADGLCRTTVHGFGSLGVYSASASRPFDRDRSGMNLGEGAAALLLEPLDAALARGATPLALLEGWGNTSDAHHLSAPHPQGAGATRAIAQAMGDCARVDWVCAHGTGTELNDRMEAAVLAPLGAAVSGIKGAVGHTLGAAGALEAVVTVLALRDGRLPPNANLVNPENTDVDWVMEQRAGRIDQALSVNFAFGGHNTALRFARWTG